MISTVMRKRSHLILDKKIKEGSWALGGRESLMEMHVKSVAWMLMP